MLELKRLQYRAIHVAMGVRLSTPIDVLLAEAREPPLEESFSPVSQIHLQMSGQ